MADAAVPKESTNVHQVVPRYRPTSDAALALADGVVYRGKAFGAKVDAEGESVFTTTMTGYQEVMTDPSYAAQIVTFTFPHIGNVGANEEDMESHVPGAVGCVVREEVTQPSNFRARGTFDAWLKEQGKIGLAGVDTRALTRRIRTGGAPNAVIAHHANGKFDIRRWSRRRATSASHSISIFPSARSC